MATAPICSCLEVPDEGGHHEVIKRSSGVIRRHRVSSAASSAHTTERTEALHCEVVVPNRVEAIRRNQNQLRR